MKKKPKTACRGVQSTLIMDIVCVNQIKQKSDAVELQRMRADLKSSGLMLWMYCPIVAVREIKCPFLGTIATLGGYKGAKEAVC